MLGAIANRTEVVLCSSQSNNISTSARVVTAELESVREEHLVREPRIAAKRLNILKAVLAQISGGCATWIEFGVAGAIAVSNYDRWSGGGVLSPWLSFIVLCLLESNKPVLRKESVCHTDGAKAYRWLESPLNDGTL